MSFGHFASYVEIFISIAIDVNSANVHEQIIVPREVDRWRSLGEESGFLEACVFGGEGQLCLH